MTNFTMHIRGLTSSKKFMKLCETFLINLSSLKIKLRKYLSVNRRIKNTLWGGSLRKKMCHSERSLIIVIIFYNCHVGVVRCTYIRVTLVAWLITGLELSKMPWCRFEFGAGSCSVRSPLVDELSPLCCRPSACRCAMWSIEIRSSMPFSYGCTCNRCNSRFGTFAPLSHILYIISFAGPSQWTVQLNSCTIKLDIITFKLPLILISII